MRKFLFITTIIFACFSTRANNIQITNVSVVPANNTIKFDVSWDNGWRSSTLNNWDAAWVFFKFKDADAEWKHMNIGPTGNIIPSGFSVSYAPVVSGIGGTFVGVFLYRSAVGSGTTTLNNVELAILPEIASGVYDIRAFGIEMVYIPQAPFYVGDGISTNAYITNNPFPANYISSNSSTVVDPINSGILNANFPKGINAFYCMKYELSQGAYRDFLNTLNYFQQGQHTATAPSSINGTTALVNLSRNFLRIKTSGINASSTPAVYGCDANNNGIYDEADDGEYVACNFLIWADQARYLQWSGLRPLTELEYEKAARGIQLPVSGEYAWGNSNIFIGPPYYSYSNLNMSSEVITNASASPTGNSHYASSYNVTGPTRNGIFATATSNRISSGASFYGVMELSGNLWERVITTANTQGRGFLGNHGNGVLISLSLNGWPGFDGSFGYVNPIFNATGIIYRGGGWSLGSSYLRISDRSGTLVIDANNIRANDVGARGCRTAP
jgi:formylglycine-generating enzyme required for sulfatase activity